jgi:hypothetical protein
VELDRPGVRIAGEGGLDEARQGRNFALHLDSLGAAPLPGVQRALMNTDRPARPPSMGRGGGLQRA